MTTTLGFVRRDTFDPALGEGGTLRLLVDLARHLGGRVRVVTDDGFEEVRADGTVAPKVFTEAEDPDDDFVPTVRRLGFVGWPSDAAPRLPDLVVPAYDDQVDLAALRAEPSVAALGRWVGTLEDAELGVALPTGAESEAELRADAENLLQVAFVLGLALWFG